MIIKKFMRNQEDAFYLPNLINTVISEKLQETEDTMKEERDVVVIACRPMAGASPAAVNSPATQLFPTPSPFSFSVATTGWSSRPAVYYSNSLLRSVALLFSFVSALSLTLTAPSGAGPSSFSEHPELMYSLIVSILAFVYSAFQLSKGVCDITHRGICITDKVSDYINFILDQLVGYLLVSSSSVTIPAIQHIDRTAPLWKASIVSVSMSFATFLVTAICALFSGYKLCKRVIW